MTQRRLSRAPGLRAAPVTLARADAPSHADLRRGSSARRGYGWAWQKASKAHLRAHPLCVRCEAAGRVELATEVDHIVPHRGDQARFWDSDNWQGLCHACHSAKTAGEDGGFGNAAR